MKRGERGTPPPYGPTQGTIQTLQLLQRQSPARVDETFLRSQGIAPRNEYKIVGALRFLGLIDEDGRPAERAHLLKTRGATFTLNLQEIVREAYSDLFREVRSREATREAIYNYFVTKARLGGEMATKATRFFRSLCQWAGIPLPEEPPARRGGRRGPSRATASSRTKALGPAGKGRGQGQPLPVGEGLPLMLAITPETARLAEEELVELFRKIRRAAQQSAL
ncbi:MAG: DUF5343 domain-containing protein [Dehalococcoidia bacterium]|nr:DUF5343 domain-containing protein [Dehalococcoidia bacterium]